MVFAVAAKSVLVDLIESHSKTKFRLESLYTKCVERSGVEQFAVGITDGEAAPRIAMAAWGLKTKTPHAVCLCHAVDKLTEKLVDPRHTNAREIVKRLRDETVPTWAGGSARKRVINFHIPSAVDSRFLSSLKGVSAVIEPMNFTHLVVKELLHHSELAPLKKYQEQLHEMNAFLVIFESPHQNYFSCIRHLAQLVQTIQSLGHEKEENRQHLLNEAARLFALYLGTPIWAAAFALDLKCRSDFVAKLAHHRPWIRFFLRGALLGIHVDPKEANTWTKPTSIVAARVTARNDAFESDDIETKKWTPTEVLKTMASEELGRRMPTIVRAYDQLCCGNVSSALAETTFATVASATADLPPATRQQGVRNRAILLQAAKSRDDFEPRNSSIDETRFDRLFPLFLVLFFAWRRPSLKFLDLHVRVVIAWAMEGMEDRPEEQRCDNLTSCIIVQRVGPLVHVNLPAQLAELTENRQSVASSDESSDSDTTSHEPPPADETDSTVQKWRVAEVRDGRVGTETFVFDPAVDPWFFPEEVETVDAQAALYANHRVESTCKELRKIREQRSKHVEQLTQTLEENLRSERAALRQHAEARQSRKQHRVELDESKMSERQRALAQKKKQP